MTLEILDQAERQILEKVTTASGLMEEKHRKLTEKGVYGEYQAIFEQYVDLIESPVEGLEALKRAVFLRWYEDAEPSCFSGLDGLSEQATRKIFESLDKRLKSKEIDSELEWMLAYYNEVAEWVFSPYLYLFNVRNFLSETKSQLPDKADVQLEN